MFMKNFTKKTRKNKKKQERNNVQKVLFKK